MFQIKRFNYSMKEESMKRSQKFLKAISNWTSIITFITACIAFVISFFCEQFSYKIITLMFVLLATENFIKQFTCMEDIKERLERLALYSEDGIKNINERLNNLTSYSEGCVIVKTIEDFIGEINDLLRIAQNDIIIIGDSLIKLMGSNNIIEDLTLKRGVKVRLLALNIEKKEIFTEYNKLVDHYNGAPVNLNHLQCFKSKNIEIRTYEVLPTAYYIATDLNFPYGHIQTIPILSGEHSENKYPKMEINHSNEYWYNVYHEHIESLWKKGTPWGNRHHFRREEDFTLFSDTQL
jgi:hypothetical protein